MKKKLAFNMKNLFTILILLISLNVFSQDIITTNKGENIEAKVEEIGTEEIKYKKQNNLDGPLYFIKKDDVSKIVFKNGAIETFDSSIKDNSLSLESTKKFIVDYINKYAYDKSDFEYNHKLLASFEGDYLRLKVMNSDNTRSINGGKLFDFTKTYKFHNVSYRNNELAYINVFVPVLINQKKNKWQKDKLVIRVKGHSEADSILNALRHYNKLFIPKKEGFW